MINSVSHKDLGLNRRINDRGAVTQLKPKFFEFINNTKQKAGFDLQTGYKSFRIWVNMRYPRLNNYIQKAWETYYC